MDFNLSEEELAIQQTVREFAEKEIAPSARERDEKSEFPFEIIKKLGKLGICGVCASPEYGGAGMSYLSYTIII